ncbi:DUF1643 domain-containing protein [Paraburkholderia sp. MM5477-R1]|uniref:DUF1643 domain-containing protein n=1 Tax=Paraburkholderia sp. MM5477-R1 TaxID=2991062 RepID=UPI003D24092C
MSAIISECGGYRYILTRAADSMCPMKTAAVFVMLNPSTADEEQDDPTIRRCRGFARLWDCNGISVANLYALRSTDPAGLWVHPDPVGPDNDAHLCQIASIETRNQLSALGESHARSNSRSAL